MTISAKERALIFQAFLFQGIRDEVLTTALQDARAELRSYAKGDVIFSGAQFERAFCILLSGRICVSKDTDDGRGLLISTLTPGACFGAAALFNDCPVFPTVLTALTSCRVLLLPEAQLLELMQLDFTIAERYIRYQSGRILFLNEKIASLSAGSAEKRLARWLLENARETERGLLCASVRMSSLASSLNIGRASLYRALDALAHSGAIVHQNKDILIQNPALLRQL